VTTNVGSATLTIVPSAKGFAGALGRDIDGPLVAAGSTGGKKAGKAAGAGMTAGLLPIVGRAIPAIGAAFAGLQLGKFIGDSVGSASDLEEVTSKISVVMGKKALPALNAFGDAAAKNMGQSKTAALDAVATFAIFGKSAGLRGKELTSFSTDFTTLASDLASFSNTSPEEAITAIGAALRGENEPIRRYGVLLDDASLRQEALRQGLIKTTKTALTPQQKVLAAQALIYKQTKDAQGDFARTSGGMANQQRILAAQFETLKTKVGSAFLPIFTKVVNFANTTIVPALMGIADVVGPVISAVGDFFGAFFGGGADTKASGAMKGVGDAVKGVGGILKDNEGTISTFSEIAKTLGDIFATVGEIIRDVVAPAVSEIAGYFAGALGEAFRAIGEVMRDPILPALKELGAKFKEMAPVLKPVIAAVLKVWAAWYKLYYSALAKVLVVIIKIAAFLGGQLLTSFGRVIESVGRVIEIIGNWRETLAKLPQAVREKIDAVKRFFSELPGKIKSAFGAAGSMLFSIGQNIVQGLINGIKSIAAAPVNAIRDIGSNIVNGISSVLGIQSPSKVFKKIGEFVGQGFVKGIVASRREVARTMRRLGELVTKSGKDGLDALVKRDEARLLKLATRRDKAIKRLENTKSRLDDLLSGKESLRDSITSGINDIGALAENGGSFDVIVARMTYATDLAKRFGGELAALKSAKLDPALIQQIAEMDPISGSRAARLVLSRGPEGVAQLNALQAQMTAASSTVAKETADTLYDSGIQAAKGLIKGLKEKIPDIEATMKKIADSLAKAIRKALGIKSPSRVMAEIGAFTMAGFVQGVDGGAGAAKGAMLAAITPPGAPQIGSAVGVGGVAGGGLNVVVNNPAPEPASRSVQTALQRVAYIGIGG
jgi:hypothetical protein